jgi:hypothetical protein
MKWSVTRNLVIGLYGRSYSIMLLVDMYACCGRVGRLAVDQASLMLIDVEDM